LGSGAQMTCRSMTFPCRWGGHSGWFRLGVESRCQFFFTFAVQGFELTTYTFEPLHHTFFCKGIFWDRSLTNYLPGLALTAILLISCLLELATST
jgi:hypothetical protein